MRHTIRARKAVGFVFTCFAFVSCGEAPAPADYLPAFSREATSVLPRPVYSFGVRPGRSTKALWQTYAPLVREVNASLTNFAIRLESALTETAFDSKMRRGELDAALVEPHRVLDLEPCGYSVFARAGDRDRIAGVLVAAKNLDIRRPKDLRGRVICFGSPGALASTMLVKVHLKRAGFDVEREAELRYTGSSDSSLLNVLTGDAAAAGVSRLAWARFASGNPDAASMLEPLWHTDELPGPALMAHSRMLSADVKELRDAFLALSRSESGRSALAAAQLNSIQLGESGSYDALWEFLHEYSRLFKHVPLLGGRR